MLPEIIVIGRRGPEREQCEGVVVGAGLALAACDEGMQGAETESRTHYFTLLASDDRGRWVYVVECALQTTPRTRLVTVQPPSTKISKSVGLAGNWQCDNALMLCAQLMKHNGETKGALRAVALSQTRRALRVENCPLTLLICQEWKEKSTSIFHHL